MIDLKSIRQDIDILDKELVRLLEQRLELVNQVIAYKKETGKPILDSQREEAVLSQMEELVTQPEYKPTIRAIFSDIMRQSRIYQGQKLGSGNETSESSQN